MLCLVQRPGDADARPHRRELVPAHSSAGGTLLLGHRDRWRESVLGFPLEPVTERMIVDADTLRADCVARADRGIGYESGEYLPGRESIAAPVRDPSGEVVAAVAVTGAAELRIRERADACAPRRRRSRRGSSAT